MKQGPEGASALPGAQLSPGARHPGPGQDAAVRDGAAWGWGRGTSMEIGRPVTRKCSNSLVFVVATLVVLAWHAGS